MGVGIEQFGQELLKLVEEDRRTNILLNFESVEYLSSAALVKLIALHKAVKARGGTVIVQDPEHAEVRSMPDAALEAVDADYVLPLAEIVFEDPQLWPIVSYTAKWAPESHEYKGKSYFEILPREYLRTRRSAAGLIGAAQSHLFEAADVNRFAVEWLEHFGALLPLSRTLSPEGQEDQKSGLPR